MNSFNKDNSIVFFALTHSLQTTSLIMSNETTGVFVDVPRPIAILLESAYVILLGLSILASLSTAGCLLWHYLDIGCPISTSFLETRTTSDEIRYKDEESGEARGGLEFEDDTDEEYMRRPY